MKKLCRFLCVLALSIFMLLVSACTFFGNETVTISRIYTVPGEEGGMYIVIEYEGDREPDSFFIEEAEAGKEGNGIREITSRKSEDGFSTIVTISYTDISIPPVDIPIPNGTYIAGIVTETDPETNVVSVTINFSDDTPPVSFDVQPGRDGKDGDTISRFETEEDEEGNLILHVYVMRHNVETGEYEEIEVGSFTIPKGERGNGILSIGVNYRTYDDPNNMYLDIFYEDGSYETIALPRSNSWYTGAGAPNHAWYNVGDFYFDTTGYAIYQKQVDGWVKLVDFSEFNSEQHAVYFYLDNEMLADIKYITHGYNFASTPTESLSEPQREGYKFLGWYTEYIEVDGEPSPNAGHFTVLTPVLSNTVLYARWATV